jgi:hypothetical protein
MLILVILSMAGYSKRALIDKLGIKPGQNILIMNGPPNYADVLGPLPDGVHVLTRLSGTLDFIQFFTKSRSDYEQTLLALKARLAQNGMIWISWPKGASKVPTDMNENIVRDYALANGLVDVKVAAIDEIWSGLKLVIPLALRR